MFITLGKIMLAGAAFVGGAGIARLEEEGFKRGKKVGERNLVHKLSKTIDTVYLDERDSGKAKTVLCKDEAGNLRFMDVTAR